MIANPSLSLNSQSRILPAYFRSGWAFLIPYLVAYLLYAWLRWPVNEATAGSGEHGTGSWVPCLLYVYWTLHVVHLALGVFALRAWWKNTAGQRGGEDTAQDSTYSLRPPASALLYRLLPWLCLALLIWIPGVYLEYPADPWEHYARINEWGHAGLVTDHPTWTKSSYFLAYSLLGQMLGNRQLAWLDGYYTACCLLLCWQYFRLARVVGLQPAPAMAFVLLQVFLFGNNLFSFYRYYGIASTLFSQLAAIAMIRLGLEFAVELKSRASTRAPTRTLLSAGAIGLMLTALMRFNHVQGLGIAALGLAAIAVWAVIDWRRSSLWWLGALLLLLNLAAYWFWPRQPALDTYYAPEGWLNSWYGFNLFSPSSIVGERTLQILGIIGVLNFGAGLWLLRRNHVVGWLTITPIIALCLPLIVIPFVNVLVTKGGGNTITNLLTFNRMFLGIPVGLAMLVVISRLSHEETGSVLWRSRFRTACVFLIMPLALGVATTLPAGGPYYNRTWNALSVVPSDLRLRQVTDARQGSHGVSRGTAQPDLLSTRAVAFAAHATGAYNINKFAGHRFLEPYHIPSDQSHLLIESIISVTKATQPVRLYIPSGLNLASPGSQAGYLSHHWSPQYVALDRTGAREYDAAAQERGWLKGPESGNWHYLPAQPGK